MLPLEETVLEQFVQGVGLVAGILLGGGGGLSCRRLMNALLEINGYRACEQQPDYV